MACVVQPSILWTLGSCAVICPCTEPHCVVWCLCNVNLLFSPPSLSLRPRGRHHHRAPPSCLPGPLHPLVHTHLSLVCAPVPSLCLSSDKQQADSSLLSGVSLLQNQSCRVPPTGREVEVSTCTLLPAASVS